MVKCKGRTNFTAQQKVAVLRRHLLENVVVEVSVVLEGVAAPADIGLDARRGRLPVPLFMDDRVEIHPIG
jgi:hypothetical protein